MVIRVTTKDGTKSRVLLNLNTKRRGSPTHCCQSLTAVHTVCTLVLLAAVVCAAACAAVVQCHTEELHPGPSSNCHRAKLELEQELWLELSEPVLPPLTLLS